MDDAGVLHIRCGADLSQGLRAAGCRGDYLEFSDPVCHGPVPADGALDAARAAFIANAYGVPAEEVAARLLTEARGLRESRACAQAVLWFEHDLYDQAILARILAHFAEARTPDRLEIITIDRHPGVEPFYGLGQLSPEQLAGLWPHRQPVDQDMLDAGRAIWAAIREPTPKALAAIKPPASLPFMSVALGRWLQELPWTRDGLSLTQRRLLGAFANGAATPGQAFRQLQAAEPAPWLGDLMVWAELNWLAAAGDPAIVMTSEDAFHLRAVTLTPTGRALLNGECDWLTCSPANRWIGGVEIRADRNAWRWDDARAAPVFA